MKITPSITGIILAGGKSRRIRQDKAFLKLGSKTIIEELISRLENKFPKLMIVANDPEKYTKCSAKIVKDIMPGNGSLGGIYTGLVASDNFYNFIFACDAPFVNLELIDTMIAQIKDADIIVPKWRQRFEPLHAIYSKRCIKHIERQLKKADLKIINFFSNVRVKVIEQEELEKFNLGWPLFININTKEDYSGIAEMADIKLKENYAISRPI